MTGAYVDIDRPSFGVRDEVGADGGSGAGLFVDIVGWIADKAYGLFRKDTWVVSVFDPEAEGNGTVAVHRVDGSAAAVATAKELAAAHGITGAPLEIRAHAALEHLMTGA